MIAASKITLRGLDCEIALSPNKSVRGGMTEFAIPGFEGVAVCDDQWVDGNLPPLWIADSEVGLFEPIRLREHTEYDFTITVKATAQSISRDRQANPVFPFQADKLAHYISFNSEDACTALTDGRYRLTGRLNFGGYAGKADLSLADAFALEVVVDVVSTKIGYETDFQRLLEQLSDIHAELILNMDGATEVALGPDLEKAASDQMQVFHLRRLFHDSVLPQSIAAILSQPHFRYKAYRRNDPIAFVTDPDMTAISVCAEGFRWEAGGPVAHVFRGFTPESLPTHAVEKTYDTPENRFVKTTIRALQNRIASLLSRIPDRYAATRTALNRWGHELEDFIHHPLWQEVSDSYAAPNSMVLQQRHGYRDLLRDFLAFEFGLRLNTSLGEYDSTSGDLKPVHEMYELWCYFQLRAVLDVVCRCEGTPPLGHIITEKGYKVDLNKGRNSAVCYEIRHLKTPVTVNFYYNRTFSRLDESTRNWTESYSAPFHPDFSLEIVCNHVPHWVHFDAKYKLNSTEWREVVELNGAGTHSYKTEDLQRMHSYRDALLGTRASFILYPGAAAAPDVFIRQIDKAYRKSHLGPSVGAFSLTPAKSGVIDREQLTQFVGRIIESISTASAYSEEEGFT